MSERRAYVGTELCGCVTMAAAFTPDAIEEYAVKSVRKMQRLGLVVSEQSPEWVRANLGFRKDCRIAKHREQA